MAFFLCRFWSRQAQLKPVQSRTQEALAHYLTATQPCKRNRIKDSQLIAIDFETTGLDFQNDEIISMGFCPIHKGVIKLAECQHIIVKTRQALSSENVTIHGLTDDQVRQGISPEAALTLFLEKTKGKVVLAHYHPIERAFLQKLALYVLGRRLPISFIDTYAIAKQRMQRREQAVTSESLRLFNLRKQQGLPNYKAHNALEDAISTAELFLAQQADYGGECEQVKLKELGLFQYRK